MDDSQSLLARVTRDGIVETAVKESVDFIVRLGERPDVGRNIYKQVFPKSKDKAKEKTDSFSSVVRYCQRLQQSNYKLCFAYKPGKDAGGFGRLYAQTRQNFVPTSQQMMRASVRQFLQTYQHCRDETLEQARERHDDWAVRRGVRRHSTSHKENTSQSHDGKHGERASEVRSILTTTIH